MFPEGSQLLPKGYGVAQEVPAVTERVVEHRGFRRFLRGSALSQRASYAVSQRVSAVTQRSQLSPKDLGCYTQRVSVGTRRISAVSGRVSAVFLSKQVFLKGSQLLYGRV